MSLWLVLLGVLALSAAACVSDLGDAAPASTANGDDVVNGDGIMSRPGEGVTVVMARANWATGYFHAQVQKQLLEMLGYTVTEPSEKELEPALAYLAMAVGDIDFWANTWIPLHNSWLGRSLPDGSPVADYVEVLGQQMISGGLSGYLVSKSVADEQGITHLDQINDFTALTALFDVDGDGVVGIYGCEKAWTCDDVIETQIAISQWENIEQIIGDYDDMFHEAEARIKAGEPVVIWATSPSSHILRLRPGHDVYWLAVEDVIDDSNPTGFRGGEAHDQRPGTAIIPPQECPAAAGAGVCQLGWVASDILITANKDFLDANPAARALWEQVVIPPLDVALAHVEQEGGMETEAEIAALAAQWIGKNSVVVNQWLFNARTATADPSP